MTFPSLPPAANPGAAPNDKTASNARDPVRVALFAPTTDHLGGSDRDLITLANALGPAELRLSWIGIQGTEFVRELLDPRVCHRVFDLPLPPFTYLVFQHASVPRSRWLWSKILLDYASRCAPALWRILRELRGEPLDVVVSSTAVTLIGALFAAARRLPHVWIVKECLDPTLPATRSYARWIERLSSRVVVPSRAVATPFSSRVLVLPDGNDCAAIQEAPAYSRAEVLRQLGLPEDRPLLLQIGGTVPLKGAHVTVEALGRLWRDGGHGSCSFLLLGGPNDAYRQELEGRLAAIDATWSHYVRIFRSSPGDYRYLFAADVVVHPSVLADSYPNAVREAMILGKPVVASRIGGIPEMIRDGETGLLVQPGDPGALASAVARLLKDPELRALLGSQAHRYAARTFDIAENKKPFARLLRSLAAGEPGTNALGYHRT